MPLRIVIGYDGYSNEYALRNGFEEILADNQYEPVFGPAQFPNLIICSDYSLVKSNGMPYGGFFKENQWYVYNSSSNKPMLHLLEIIWSRLSYRYGLDSGIFGEDLEVEG